MKELLQNRLGMVYGVAAFFVFKKCMLVNRRFLFVGDSFLLNIYTRNEHDNEV